MFRYFDVMLNFILWFFYSLICTLILIMCYFIYFVLLSCPSYSYSLLPVQLYWVSSRMTFIFSRFFIVIILVPSNTVSVCDKQDVAMLCLLLIVNYIIKVYKTVNTSKSYGQCWRSIRTGSVDGTASKSIVYCCTWKYLIAAGTR